MRAAVVSSFDRPVELVERPVPGPAAGQVLARIEASGLCNTDIPAARGDWPVGVTTSKAVKVSGPRPTERAAIFGIGGFGHLAPQYARIFGAETFAVDVIEDELRLAAARVVFQP